MKRSDLDKSFLSIPQTNQEILLHVFWLNTHFSSKRGALPAELCINFGFILFIQKGEQIHSWFADLVFWSSNNTRR